MSSCYKSIKRHKIICTKFHKTTIAASYRVYNSVSGTTLGFGLTPNPNHPRFVLATMSRMFAELKLLVRFLSVSDWVTGRGKTSGITISLHSIHVQVFLQSKA